VWKFTQLADVLDELKDEENHIVDTELMAWAGRTVYDDSPWYRNVGVWVGVASATLYSVNKFTTTVAGGFIDVLRLGDGVKQGGWGYGKDAVRLLMVLGPALRFARWSVSLIPAVDTFPGLGNCGWIAAARLLRITGTQPLAELAQVAKWEALAAAETGGIDSTRDMVPVLQLLGASARAGGPVANMTELSQLVARNPQAAIMFGVRWLRYRQPVGHVLIAVRGFFGGMQIIDRTGRVVKSLAELERAVPAYKGIGSAVLADTVIVNNSLLVRSMSSIPSLANVVSQAAGQIPGPVSTNDSISHDQVAVKVGAANDTLGASAQGYGSASHGAANAHHTSRGVHNHRAHAAELSATARKIYQALGTSHNPVPYRQIMERTHLHIDDVIRGVRELADRGAVAIVPLKR
jgi:hypothetical protein